MSTDVASLLASIQTYLLTMEPRFLLNIKLIPMFEFSVNRITNQISRSPLVLRPKEMQDPGEHECGRSSYVLVIRAFAIYCAVYYLKPSNCNDLTGPPY